MSKVRNVARGAKETVKTYPASTTTPFIVLVTDYARSKGWIDTGQQLWIIAAWPAVVTFYKEKIAPRIFGEED